MPLPNHITSESPEEPFDPRFSGTIDQLIGYNVAELRAQQGGLTQADIELIFHRVTGRPHKRNWLSRRESGEQPFTVADLIILAAVFKVPILRFLQVPKTEGLVWVDGLNLDVRTFLNTLLIEPEQSVADLVEKDAGRLKYDLGQWVEFLKENREHWIGVTSRNEEWGQMVSEAHEPHPTAGKRREAWKRRMNERIEQNQRLRQALEAQKGSADAQTEED